MSANPLADEILATVPTGAELQKKSQKANKDKPDLNKIRKTFEFWSDVFINLGEDIFKKQNSESIRFSKAVPNILMTRVSAFKERNKLLETGSAEGFKAQEQQFLIKSSGCLVSISEIESFIGIAENKLFDELKTFKKTALGQIKKPDMELVNRATRGCRELADLIRKISYCKKIAREYSINYYDVLALYRQEGGLVLTPFKDSYLFGTLINTEKMQCRSPDVVLSLSIIEKFKKPTFLIEPERTINKKSGLPQLETLAKRPGFNLAYSTSIKNASNETYRMIMILANLLVTGGLDILLKNPPNSHDELSQLFKQNLNNSQSFAERITNFTPFLKIDNLALQSEFLTLFLGLMLFIFEHESHKGTIPKIYDLSSQAEDLINQLFRSHHIEVKQNKKSGKLANICLIGNNQSPDTLLVLRIQAMWYTTRRFPYTLLAFRDRDESFKKLPPFSPFVNYMRFHADELIFLGILIRVLKSFRASKKLWTKKIGSKKAPSDLKFPDFKPEEETMIKKAFDGIKGIKDDISNPIKSWSSLGLVDYYIQKKIIPAWFDQNEFTTDTADYKIRVVQSEVALNIMRIIKKYELIDTLNFILEFTPIKTFFDIKVFEDGNNPERKLFMTKVFTKSHSFERVRLVYKAADENSALEEE